MNPQSPAGNSPWFTLYIADLPYSVLSFRGTEEVSRVYEFTIEFVSKSANEDIRSRIGAPACLVLQDRSASTRFIHGLIASMEQVHIGNTYTRYSCTLVPRLWFLDKTRDHRIFQNKSVPDIVHLLLEEHGFTDVEFKLFHEYEPREYCVQYGESCLHFLSRICEEEGIYFYFTHAQTEHTLCFCDREGGPPISDDPLIRYAPGSGQAAENAVISRVRHSVNASTNAAAYREWNFEKPRLDLGVERDDEEAPAPPGMPLEHYQYPHLYRLRDQGTRYVDIQVLRQLTFQETVDVVSDVCTYLPSYVFQICDHPRLAVNAPWWVVSVSHAGEQPQVLEHEAPDGQVFSYQSRVSAIPDRTRFIPPLAHPKRLIAGQQTAIVTGPEGEDIYVDQYGRVKVQFHWDREGQADEHTSCWVRVSQLWAGPQYGSSVSPRIGHEVVISFLEGDPDRPLITGRVHNTVNPVPYPLPENKNRSVIFKSASTPGEDGSRGYNELSVTDSRDEEEIYLHAQKDVNTHTRNDWKDHILHDRHQRVDNDTFTLTRGETNEELHGQRKTEIHANDNLTVHGEIHTRADDKILAEAGDEVHLKGGASVVIEAGVDLTLKAGGSFIRLTPAGIVGVGAAIGLNEGGSPGAGSGAAPLLPSQAAGVEERDKPVIDTLRLAAALRSAQANAQPLCATCGV